MVKSFVFAPLKAPFLSIGVRFPVWSAALFDLTLQHELFLDVLFRGGKFRDTPLVQWVFWFLGQAFWGILPEISTLDLVLIDLLRVFL